ncbi:hypothetical protein [Pseudohaliea sp.]|uniref:hypothetical protein n=1 Tax=Pseudohaliea sp. TaxID=2740289 RepID=UPI0032ECE3BA
METIKLQQKARGERPQYLDAEVEKVLSITMALAGEVAVMRERIDSIERLLEKAAVITREDVGNYVPTAKEHAEREAWREGFLDVVLRVVTQEKEALEEMARGMESYDEAVKRVESAD